jgi:hypothetical protein
MRPNQSPPPAMAQLCLVSPRNKTMAFVNSAVPLGGYMSRTMLFIATVSFLGCLPTSGMAQEADGGRRTTPPLN